MKYRILNNKLRFSVVFLSFLSLTLLFVMSCDMEPVATPDSDLILNEAVENEMLKRGVNQIEICHFPPGNPDNPQKITVGVNAASSHINNHEGDGIVGVDYDENCQPLNTATCPCYSEDDLSALDWGIINDNDIDSDNWETTLTATRLVTAYAAYVDSKGVSRCSITTITGSVLLNGISRDEANACRTLLFEFGPDSKKDPGETIKSE